MYVANAKMNYISMHKLNVYSSMQALNVSSSIKSVNACSSANDDMLILFSSMQT